MWGLKTGWNHSIIQMRDLVVEDGVAQILDSQKVKMKGLFNGSDVGCGRKRGVRDDSFVFVLNS